MTAALRYLSYADVRGLVEGKLVAFGYAPTLADGTLPGGALAEMPAFSPGPFDDSVAKVSPRALVVLTVGGGAGLTTEDTFDRLFVAVRTVGPQTDFPAAERLAFAVDRALLSLGGSARVGATYTLGFDRTGGAPQPLLQDDAERYHFTASYIGESETGI